jgi:coenzyme F420-0:L-glutamate ligase/coenzyme F420-1:gamma-L-glutamate ligase
MFCADPVQQVLQLPPSMAPLGAIAVGYPAAAPRDREPRTVDQFILEPPN